VSVVGTEVSEGGVLTTSCCPFSCLEMSNGQQDTDLPAYGTVLCVPQHSDTLKKLW
jgi:hypothetical protein